MMYKIIALDIGGVCVKLRYDLALVHLGYSSRQEVPPEFLYATDQFERGKINETEWLKIFRMITGGRFDDNNLRQAWNLIIGEAMENMTVLARDLTAAGCRLIYFSDTSPLHVMEVYRKLPFAHLVSGGIFSFEVGAKKPEAPMYRSFEETYGKPYWYIDDLENNIAGGEKFGWRSHRFISAENFRKEFFAADSE